MKNIFKVLFLSILLVTITSCDNEDTVQLTLAPQGSGVITEPAQGTTIVLNPEESQTNPAITINWTSSSYGTPTEITYVVEVALAGTDFEVPFIAASTTNRYVTWNIGELNNIAVSAGLSPFIEGELAIRLVSTVGTVGSQEQVSETVIIFVTPFTTDLPKIAVPGMHQGWDPGTAPLLASSGFGETDYEGYVWLIIEGDEGFKFLAPDETGGFFWGNTDWGDDGTNTGKLVADDEVNCKVEDDGYYLVKVDTDELTYSTEIMNWSLTGDATPLSWPPGDSDGVAGNDHDMTYNSDTKTLSVTLDLTAASIKFRANDAWTVNLGDNDADGSLEFGGSDIAVSEAGNYTVILDLSTPREYTYSLVKN